MSFQRPTPRLILASQSVSRAALLTQAGLIFSVIPAGIDETQIKVSRRAAGRSADDVALTLAHLKAERVARRERDALVIGADQLLVCGDEWFDKPNSLGEARDHLRRLRGRRHCLVTAVVCHWGEARIWTHLERPLLDMRDISDAFLDAYLAAEGLAVTETVGAYRLEALGIQLFDRIDGEHSAILGLPMLPLLGFLRQHGVALA